MINKVRDGSDGFLHWDFADLHTSLIMATDNEKRLGALLSNNLNVILAALKRCGEANE